MYGKEFKAKASWRPKDLMNNWRHSQLSILWPGYAGKTDFSTFPTIEGTDGFCLCVDDVPKYISCPENSQYDLELGACTATEVGYS